MIRQLKVCAPTYGSQMKPLESWATLRRCWRWSTKSALVPLWSYWCGDTTCIIRQKGRCSKALLRTQEEWTSGIKYKLKCWLPAVGFGVRGGLHLRARPLVLFIQSIQLGHMKYRSLTSLVGPLLITWPCYNGITIWILNTFWVILLFWRKNTKNLAWLHLTNSPICQF